MVQLVVGYYNPFMDSCFHCIVVFVDIPNFMERPYDILLNFGYIGYTIIDPHCSFDLEYNCFDFACELEQSFVEVDKME
jgi:hypothetical protein